MVSDEPHARRDIFLPAQIGRRDALMQAARERARQLAVTLTTLISDALRRTLTEPALAEFRLDLPVTKGRRMPTVDIDSNAALEEYLDRAERRGAVS